MYKELLLLISGPRCFWITPRKTWILVKNSVEVTCPVLQRKSMAEESIKSFPF